MLKIKKRMSFNINIQILYNNIIFKMENELIKCKNEIEKIKMINKGLSNKLDVQISLNKRLLIQNIKLKTNIRSKL